VPAVVSAADAGDRTACEVLTNAGTELATLAKIVIRRLFSEALDITIAMSGGVFRHCTLVRQVFHCSLRAEYPNVELSPTVIDPVKGALALARKGARPGMNT
jgi:N-acetylglucosamine kinase-like BadF-type ATPase